MATQRRYSIVDLLRQAGRAPFACRGPECLPPIRARQPLLRGSRKTQSPPTIAHSSLYPSRPPLLKPPGCRNERKGVKSRRGSDAQWPFDQMKVLNQHKVRTNGYPENAVDKDRLREAAKELGAGGRRRLWEDQLIR